MKAAMWGVVLVIMGLIGIAVINSFENITSTNEQNYFLVKEVTEAAMYDAIDWGYYSLTGELKINGEKFMENFTRRFAQTVNIQREYNVSFYDVIELPPKVSLSVGSNVFITVTEQNFNVLNNIDAIFEYRER
ncbi:MAG: DUF5411 family protein [Bacilli bacterium]|jgi:hypothetical protein|nr:DUF5411 family protein [Bacilli bacterium]